MCLDDDIESSALVIDTTKLMLELDTHSSARVSAPYQVSLIINALLKSVDIVESRYNRIPVEHPPIKFVDSLDKMLASNGILPKQNSPVEQKLDP